jgi:hypothetical protein
MYNRQSFTIVTDTGVAGEVIKGDTGGAIFGEIMQVRVLPTVADTGGDLEIGLYPRMADTGSGWLIYNNPDCLGTDLMFAPRQRISVHLADDTGGDTDTGWAPYVAAGDRLRVKVRAGRVVAAGGTNEVTVLVYSRNDA